MPKQMSKKIRVLIIFLNMDGVTLRAVIVFFFCYDATLDDLNTVFLVAFFEGLMADTTFTVGIHIKAGLTVNSKGESVSHFSQ